MCFRASTSFFQTAVGNSTEAEKGENGIKRCHHIEDGVVSIAHLSEDKVGQMPDLTYRYLRGFCNKQSCTNTDGPTAAIVRIHSYKSRCDRRFCHRLHNDGRCLVSAVDTCSSPTR